MCRFCLKIGALIFVVTLSSFGAPDRRSIAARTSVTQNGSDIQISNGFVQLTLEAATGSIKSIVDTQTQLQLVSVAPGQYHALWAMELTSAGSDPLRYVDNNGTKPGVTITDTTAQLVWNGLNFTDGTRRPSAQVTVTISLAPTSRTAAFTFQAASLGGISVKHLYLPVINGIGVLGRTANDNYLALPEYNGRLYPDPVNNLDSFGSSYPAGQLSMQMAAFYNSDAGLFVASHDSGGNTKSIQWWTTPGPPKTATLRFNHVLPDQPTDAINLPYEVVIGTFNGDWTAAADLYKDWASQQQWVQDAIRKGPPTWMADLGPARLFDDSQRHQLASSSTSYQPFLQEQSANFSAFGAPSLVTLWGWENLGTFFSGAYFPPNGGWTAFDQMVAVLHQQHNRLDLLISPIFVDAATPMWQDSSTRGAASIDLAGKFVPYNILAFIPHTFMFMDPASSFWHDYIVDVVGTLAAHGVDAVQLDTWPINAFPDDYSTGHLPGSGGNWQAQSMLTILHDMRQSIASAGSQMALSTEEISEPFIGSLDFYLNRDLMAENPAADGPLRYVGVTPIPLFAYVYKPYIQAKVEYWPVLSKNNPSSYHRLAYARALLWGQIPQFTTAPSFSDSWGDQTMLAYIKNVATTRSSYARFLRDGSMLPPPGWKPPSTTVQLVADSGGTAIFTGIVDAIQASSWRSPAAETAIVLANISTNAISVAVPVDFERLRLIRGLPYQVQIDTGTGPRPMVAPVTDTTAVSVTIPAQQNAVLVFKAPQIQVLDVVNAASFASGILAPSEFVSILGANLGGTPQVASDDSSYGLGGLTVAVQDSTGKTLPSALSFTSNGQINAVLPGTVAPGRATLTVASRDGRTATIATTIAPVAPGLFSANGDGKGAPAGTAVLVGGDGTQSTFPLYICGTQAGSCAPNEIDLSTSKQAFAVLYGTGIRNRSSLSAVNVTVGGTTVPVPYAGPQGSYAGLDQINIELPKSLMGRADTDLLLTVAGMPSNTLKLKFK
jgi:uncharacterized protein (TIGR03437 family)